MPTFDNAASIIGDTAVELGLIAFNNAPADPFMSQDPNIGLLCQLLKSTGRELNRSAQWSQQLRTYTFSTAAIDANASAQGVYGLPADFGRPVDQTTWNNSNRLPSGELSPQQFAFFKSRLTGVVYNILFELLQGRFTAYPDINTPTNYVVMYQYLSSFWVVPYLTFSNYTYPGYNSPAAGLIQWAAGELMQYGGQYRMHAGAIWSVDAASVLPLTTGSYGPVGLAGTSSDGVITWDFKSFQGQDAPTAKDDIITIDQQAITRALKRDYLRAKGFPSQAAEQDAAMALERALNSDHAAPVLSLSRTFYGEPLIGPWNLPLNGTAGQ